MNNTTPPSLPPNWLARFLAIWIGQQFSLIGSALVLSPFFAEPTIALAWGVLIAGMLQLMFQLPFLGHLRMLPRLLGPRITADGPKRRPQPTPTSTRTSRG